MATPVPKLKVDKLRYDLKTIPIVQLTEDNLSKLTPLDLISFQDGDIIAKAIGLATIFDSGNSDFSHSGIVVDETVMPWLAPILKGRKAIWESTNSKTFGGLVDAGPADMVTGGRKLGSQVRPLDEVIDYYLFKSKGSRSKLTRNEQLDPKEIKQGCSYICWSELKNNPVRRTPQDTDQTYHDRLKGVQTKLEFVYGLLGMAGYEVNLAMLASTVVPAVRPAAELIHEICGDNKETLQLVNEMAGEEDADLKYQFCSELVFRVWQLMGLAPLHISASKITPVEFFGSKSQKLDTLVTTITYLIPQEVKKEHFRKRIWKLKGKPSQQVMDQINQMDAAV